MVKTGCDLDIYRTLVASKKPLSVETLAEPFGADPLLLGRILRYLSSTGMIMETGMDHFHHNSTTQALADPSIQGAVNYM